MMQAIYAYLAADTTLKTLLGGVAGDSKIYPNSTKQGSAAPFLIYYTSGENRGDELLTEAQLFIEIHAATYTDMLAIYDRLIALLDVDMDIQPHSSVTVNLKSCRLSGTSDQKDELDETQRDLIFTVKYRKY